MFKYILISLINLIVFPFIFVFISKVKEDQTNVVKNKSIIKVLGVGFICFLIMATIGVIITESKDVNTPYMLAFSISIIVIFSVLVNAVLSFRLEVFDTYFVFRDFLWRKRKYNYNEITGIKRRKGNSYIVCYIILVNKKKIEVSNSMINFKMIDKKLSREGIFRKFRQQK